MTDGQMDGQMEGQMEGQTTWKHNVTSVNDRMRQKLVLEECVYSYGDLLIFTNTQESVDGVKNDLLDSHSDDHVSVTLGS